MSAKKTSKAKEVPVAGKSPAGGGQADLLTERLCEQVKDLRKKKGWTLEELASASGVSRSMLSQIERARVNPTLGVIYRIAQAFGLTISELVDAPSVATRMEVIRVEDRTHHYRSDKFCRIRTLSPLHLEKDVEFYELVLTPGGVLKSAAHFKGTREFLTVREGRVRVVSDEDTCELGKGDSVHYPADVPHAIENVGEGEAAVFLVDIYEK
jgi:transcriptional regulator with XRE-family HTH domain